MTIDDLARACILGGIAYYAFFWWWPESGGLFGTGGAWRSAPGWLRRLTRRTEGDVFLFGLLSQFWAIMLVLVGLGIGSGRLHPVVLEIELGAIIIPAVLSGVVMIWHRSGRRDV
jgi:hypothetical protein